MIPDSYRIVMRYDDEKKTFVALVPELHGVQAEGETRAEALSKVEEAIEAAIRRAAEEERELPTPLDRTDYPGELNLRISPGLHRELAFLAVEENREPEKLAAEMLALGIGLRTSGPSVPAGRQEREERTEQKGRRRGSRHGRKDYHNIMDDRASFIEYVRSIESGGGGRGRGRK